MITREERRGNFVAVTTDEPQINNWHTAIYEDDYKGLLIAMCNQNGRYPWQVNAILAGLNAKREAGDALSHPEPVAQEALSGFLTFIKDMRFTGSWDLPTLDRVIEVGETIAEQNPEPVAQEAVTPIEGLWIEEREDDALIVAPHWNYGKTCLARKPKLMSNEEWRPIAERIIAALAVAHPSPSPEQGEDDLVQRLRAPTDGFHNQLVWLKTNKALRDEAATELSALRARVAELEARATPPDSDAVRAGMVLVPRVPTGAMLLAFHAAISVWLQEDATEDDSASDKRVWQAMLAAALSNQGSSSNG